MGRVFVTSDLHFGHDREFIWGPRGFKSSQEHDETVIRNWNAVVNADDDVYILGDVMLGDNFYGCECVSCLNGRIHLVRGNHDTDTRWDNIYPTIPNVVELCGWADVIHYRKYHFYLSHWSADTANYDDDKGLWARIISLSGHTHKQEKFHNDNAMKYNVALDAHNNYPVLLDDIITDIKKYNVALDRI